VLDRVLDQGEQHERREAKARDLLGHLDRDREPAADPQLVDVEVGARELQLLLERRRGLAHAGKRGVQVVQQPVEHAPALPGIAPIEPLHVGERVEQEVRLHLRLEGLQARLGGARAQLVAREPRPRDLGRAAIGAVGRVPGRRRDDPPEERAATEAQSGRG
jgi:hypothetical protein